MLRLEWGQPVHLERPSGQLELEPELEPGLVQGLERLELPA